MKKIFFSLFFITFSICLGATLTYSASFFDDEEPEKKTDTGKKNKDAKELDVDDKASSGKTENIADKYKKEEQFSTIYFRMQRMA